MFSAVALRVRRSSLYRLLSTLFVCTVLVCGARAAISDPEGLRILVLFSNQPALPANQLILEGLEAELRAGPADPEQIFYEYLDAVRFDRPEVQEATATYFRIKYGKRPPTIVL